MTLHGEDEALHRGSHGHPQNGYSGSQRADVQQREAREIDEEAVFG